MSPVMRVTIPSGKKNEPPTEAILKLFDRRFAPSVRRGYNPRYGADVEEAWQEYVKAGKAQTAWQKLDAKEQLKSKGQLPVTDSEDDGEDDGDCEPVTSTMAEQRNPNASEQRPGESDKAGAAESAVYKDASARASRIRERMGKREGINQWRVRHHLRSEAKAYFMLRSVQGRLVPRLLAEVCLVPQDSDEAPTGEEEEYFGVGGLLLQYIEGFNLSDLAVNAPPARWQEAVQLGVDAINEINELGVVNEDCQPRNVVVQVRQPSALSSRLPLIGPALRWLRRWWGVWSSRLGALFGSRFKLGPGGASLALSSSAVLQPFHIDFAQCIFSTEYASRASYDRQRWRSDNQGAIGCIMVNKLTRYVDTAEKAKAAQGGGGGNGATRLKRLKPVLEVKYLPRPESLGDVSDEEDLDYEGESQTKASLA